MVVATLDTQELAAHQVTTITRVIKARASKDLDIRGLPIMVEISIPAKVAINISTTIQVFRVILRS